MSTLVVGGILGAALALLVVWLYEHPDDAREAWGKVKGLFKRSEP